MPLKPLPAAALRNQCDPNQFGFETTADIEEPITIIGQRRALSAIRFGIGIDQPGYNLFALGPSGVGKHAAIERFLEERSRDEPTPDDLCYVNNFDEPYQPQALLLPTGMGRRLEQDMAKFVEELRVVLPATFESEEYQNQRQTIVDALQQKQEEVLEAVGEQAKTRNLRLIRTQSGFGFAPQQDGQVIDPDAFQQLDAETQERVRKSIEEMQELLQRGLRQMPQWGRETREKIQKLNEEVTEFAIKPLIDELRSRYPEPEAVQQYFNRLQQDIRENVDIFFAEQKAQEKGQGPPQRPTPGQPFSGSFFDRFQVNVLVDNSKTQGAPVIHENSPTQANLVGRIEYTAQMGALLTNFTLIKPGALHRANGGYLVVDARKVLLQPLAYESLKRALQSGEIRIESLSQQYSVITTVTLEPQPVPLNVKLVMLGEPQIYYQLYAADPDFADLFKVSADFEMVMARNPLAIDAYARLIAGIGRQNGLRPFHRSAVAHVIERSSRLVADAERMTTHLQSIADLLREADYWAGEAERDVVYEADVEQAIEAREDRNGRIRDDVQEAILRDTVLIATAGERVGQINALSVLGISNFMFGRPSRVTARVRVGSGDIIDIERRVDMGGPLHSKGVLILTGFLGARYAVERSLPLSASLVFEQSYGGIDGDSASSTELYALLSALAQAPIRQSLAVTGSVNQYGDVQAIGGVNEKIEGFYAICKQRGLTGEQGVLIPAANVKNLMLKQEVVDAVEAGNFAIYAVEHVDQGIELLTGIAAGERDEEGNYPPDSINGRVSGRLQRLAEKKRAWQQAGKEKQNEAEKQRDEDQEQPPPEQPPPEPPLPDVRRS